MTNRRRASDTDLDDLVELAKGLAHPARLRLLAMLAGGELCVCQMTAILELAPSTVSQHLSVLDRGRLVSERKEGKLVFYRLRDTGAAATLVPALLGLLEADTKIQCDRADVKRLRRIPVATLCAADLDLTVIGVRAGAARSNASAALGGRSPRELTMHRGARRKRTTASRGGTA